MSLDAKIQKPEIVENFFRRLSRIKTDKSGNIDLHKSVLLSCHSCSQKLDRNMGTGLSVGKSMMVACQVIAAGGSPSIIGAIFSHTYGNTGASSVSSPDKPSK